MARHGPVLWPHRLGLWERPRATMAGLGKGIPFFPGACGAAKIVERPRAAAAPAFGLGLRFFSGRFGAQETRPPAGPLRVAANCAHHASDARFQSYLGVFREKFFYSVATGGIFLYSCTKKTRLGNRDRRNYIWQKRASTCHCAVQCAQLHVVPAKKCCSWPARGPLDAPTCSLKCLKCPKVRTFTCNG